MDEALRMRQATLRRKYRKNREERWRRQDLEYQGKMALYRLRDQYSELVKSKDRKIEQLAHMYEEVVTRIVQVLGKHSAVLPPAFQHIDSEELPYDYRVMIQQRLRPYIPSDYTPITAESMNMHYQLLNLVEAYQREGYNLGEGGFHLYLQTRDGKVGYYISDEALQTVGFPREVVIAQSEIMFRELEKYLLRKRGKA